MAARPQWLCHWLSLYLEWKSMLSSLLSYPSPAFALSQLVLELCRGDGVANLQTIQSHLDKIHACNAELSPTDQMVGF